MWLEASSGSNLRRKEWVHPHRRAWNSVCKRDNKQAGKHRGHITDQILMVCRSAHPPQSYPARSWKHAASRAEEKGLNSVIQQTSAWLPGKFLCSEDLCQLWKKRTRPKQSQSAAFWENIFFSLNLWECPHTSAIYIYFFFFFFLWHNLANS